jgi:hypothetical protein
MHADGSSQTRLTENKVPNAQPNWGRIPPDDGAPPPAAAVK